MVHGLQMEVQGYKLYITKESPYQQRLQFERLQCRLREAESWLQKLGTLALLVNFLICQTLISVMHQEVSTFVNCTMQVCLKKGDTEGRGIGDKTPICGGGGGRDGVKPPGKPHSLASRTEEHLRSHLPFDLFPCRPMAPRGKPSSECSWCSVQTISSWSFPPVGSWKTACWGLCKPWWRPSWRWARAVLVFLAQRLPHAPSRQAGWPMRGVWGGAVGSDMNWLQPTTFLAFCALQTTRVKSEKAEAQAGPRTRAPEAERPPSQAGGEPKSLWENGLGAALPGSEARAEMPGREAFCLVAQKGLCPFQLRRDGALAALGWLDPPGPLFQSFIQSIALRFLFSCLAQQTAVWSFLFLLKAGDVAGPASGGDQISSLREQLQQMSVTVLCSDKAQLVHHLDLKACSGLQVVGHRLRAEYPLMSREQLETDLHSDSIIQKAMAKLRDLFMVSPVRGPLLANSPTAT